MHRLRLMLISHVWKFARRSKVSSDLKIFRKMSCARSSASSCLPTNLYATLNTLRQYCLTMAAGPGFFRTAHALVCDDVSLSDIAIGEGTPTYVYSAATLRARYRAIDEAFGGYPHAIHYALKANSTFAIATLLRELGSAADANSIWEIEVARKAGYTPPSIVFTGVGKSPQELECAVTLGVKAINVESAGELARVEAIATSLGRRAR